MPSPHLAAPNARLIRRFAAAWRRAIRVEERAIESDASEAIIDRAAKASDRARRLLDLAEAGLPIPAPKAPRTRRNLIKGAFAALASIGRAIARGIAKCAAIAKATAASIAARALRAAARAARRAARRAGRLVARIAIAVATLALAHSDQRCETAKAAGLDALHQPNAASKEREPNVSNLHDLLRCILFTPTSTGWGLPVLFEGPPGGGKSSRVENEAARFALPCQVLSPGEHGEGAFGVTPVPTEEGYLGYPPPQWTQAFTERGIVFVDELKTAAPALQAPILGLVLARRIGGSYLGSRVRVIAASNSTEQSAGGWDLSPPLANRLGHLPWPAPSVEDWTTWLTTEVDDDKPPVEDAERLEEHVMNAWHGPWARARGLVAAFVRARPNLLHKMPPVGHPDASKAWPSHRTWEFATRAIASAQVHGLGEADADSLVTAFVGAGAAGELIQYRAKADLPDPADILDGKVEFTHDPKRLDRTYAVMVSTGALAFGDRDRASKLTDAKAKKAAEGAAHKRMEQLMKLLLKTSEVAADLVWVPAKQISKNHLHAFNEDSKKLMRTMLPLINDVAGGS